MIRTKGFIFNHFPMFQFSPNTFFKATKPEEGLIGMAVSDMVVELYPQFQMIRCRWCCVAKGIWCSRLVGMLRTLVHSQQDPVKKWEKPRIPNKTKQKETWKETRKCVNFLIAKVIWYSSRSRNWRRSFERGHFLSQKPSSLCACNSY